MRLLWPNNFTITAYYDFFEQPEIQNIFTLESLKNNGSTFALFVGKSVKEKFSIGVEGYLSSLSNGSKNQSDSIYENKLGFGVSVFGTYYFNPKIALTARYDRFDPNTCDYSSNDGRHFGLIALAFKPHPNVNITPNVLYEFYDNLENGVKVTPSITPRVTFCFQF